MDIINKESIAHEIPLFADVSPEELALVREKSSLVEYKKGQIIYLENSPADAFYCMVLGRVVIFTRDQHGNEKILEYLHRGKYFGIISLFTGEPHSVSARALNDCLLLVIKKEDFDVVLKKIPSLAIDVSRTLSRRLKNKDIHLKTIFETVLISIVSSHLHASNTTYTINLALSLLRETHKSVIILEIIPCDNTHCLPQRFDTAGEVKPFEVSSSGPGDVGLIQGHILKNPYGIDVLCLHYKVEDEECVKRLVGILSLLMNDYHYILMSLPSIDQFVFQVLNQSDTVHILTSSDQLELKKAGSLIEKLKNDFNFSESKLKIILNDYTLSKLNYERTCEALGHRIFATLPKIEFNGSETPVPDDPSCEYAKVIRRISRQEGDCLTGLVLGVGMAYGFCHIGVLKVIETENIPIDIIAGSSIGALMAALWATGRSSAEILKITQELRDPKSIWSLVDLTIPFIGLIKGDKLHRFLKRNFGAKTFQDVRLPLKIVSSDIKNKEPIVFDTGSLVDAIMASCAMPGLFMPFKIRERVLWDGGVIHPLPTEVLFSMGVKKIIAVNVTPSKGDILRQYEILKQQLTAVTGTLKRKPWFNVRQFFQERLKDNILDAIFSSIEVMQSELEEKEAQLADVVLHPDTSGMHWLELHRAEEFAARGEEEATRNLVRIRAIINE